jgi:hypothetical protein
MNMRCTLHVDVRLTKPAVRLLVEQVTGGRLERSTILTSWGEVGVGDDLRSDFPEDPDDFLNWPYYLDTYIGKLTTEEDFIKGIYQLRNGLVEHGVRVWIVTDLDHTFPPGWTPDG